MSWYLIYTKARQEAVAELNLRQQGYAVYLPLQSRRRRLKMQLREVTEPLFPRYLFIELNIETDLWGPIRSTRGVAQLVRFGGLPARVPTEFVELLRTQEAERIGSAEGPSFQSGDRVQIMGGVMSGYEGVFQAKTGTKRASILLDIADQYTRVQIPLDSLEGC